MLVKGAKIDGNVYRALFDYNSEGKTRILKHLIKHHAQLYENLSLNYEHICYQGNVNIIWLASTIGTIEQLKLLLEHSNQGINDLCGSQNKNALHQASSCGLADKIKLLLEKGALVNALDLNGKTALHYAVCARDVVNNIFEWTGSASKAVITLLSDD